jgi:hypothetical protein
MPHQTCSICRHEQREAIDLALRKGSPPLRTLADRHAVSKTSLLRHKGHLDPSATRMNTAEIDAVDYEIRRIQRALRKAQRSRTRPLVVNLSRELRAWITLRGKLGVMQPEKIASEPSVSPREALVIAQSVIEMNLAGDQRQQVLDWLNGLAERFRPPDATPAEQSGSADGSAELSENSDNSVTVEIDAGK